MNIKKEILINAKLITHNKIQISYEFILDINLCVIDCIKIESIEDGVVSKVDHKNDLSDLLFELNHVRVNPKLDNTEIINKLSSQLTRSGVKIFNRPDNNSISLCFRPIGKINSNVRFHITNRGKIIFMSPTNPKLSCINI